jgi:hypothetical protein
MLVLVGDSCSVRPSSAPSCCDLSSVERHVKPLVRQNLPEIGSAASPLSYGLYHTRRVCFNDTRRLSPSTGIAWPVLTTSPLSGTAKLCSDFERTFLLNTAIHDKRLLDLERHSQEARDLGLVEMEGEIRGEAVSAFLTYPLCMGRTPQSSFAPLEMQKLVARCIREIVSNCKSLDKTKPSWLN